MRDYYNVEKSASHKGEYIGYGGGVWMIRKTNSTYGNWVAVKQYAPQTDKAIYAFRLSEMSRKLSERAAQATTTEPETAQTGARHEGHHRA